MSDLKKTIEEEYLINDVLKLIMEAQNLDEFKRGEAERFYDVAVDAFTKPPDINTVNASTVSDLALKFQRAFGFSDSDRVKDRIQKLNTKFRQNQTDKRTVSSVLSELDLLSVMYKIINDYGKIDASVSGFLMEVLMVNILTGADFQARLPKGNPIEDIQIVDEDGVVKGYSLKTYAANFSRFPGSFPNLLRFFVQNPRVSYISYLVFLKNQKTKGEGQEVESITVTEQLLGSAGQGDNLIDFYKIDKMSGLTGKQQRLNFLINKAGVRREFLLNNNLATNEDLDFKDAKVLHVQNLKTLLNKRKYVMVFDYISRFSLEDYRETEQKLKSGEIVFADNVALISEFLGKDVEHTIDDILKGTNATIKKRPINKKFGVKILQETRFYVTGKQSREMRTELGVISIRKEDFFTLIQNNKNLLDGIISESFSILNNLNNNMELIFKQGETNLIQDTIKQADMFHQQSKKFASIEDTIKE